MWEWCQDERGALTFDDHAERPLPLGELCMLLQILQLLAPDAKVLLCLEPSDALVLEFHDPGLGGPRHLGAGALVRLDLTRKCGKWEGLNPILQPDPNLAKVGMPPS